MFQRKLTWILAPIALATLSGCGLFSDDPEDDPLDVIVKESVPITFTLDGSKLCPPNEDCDAEPMPSPRTVDLPPFEVPLPIDIIEATGSMELEEVASRLKRVEIESIDYKVMPNDLNVPTPEIEIHFAAFTSDNIEAQSAFLVATLPEVAAGMEAEGQAEVEQESQDKQSELLKELKFTAIPYGDKDIEEGDMFPPKGAAEYELILNMKFSANPVDALSN